MEILFDKINIALIITLLLNFLLGVLIFLNGRKRKINIVYSLNIVAIMSWVAAMIFYRSAPAETALFWCTLLYTAPTLIASSFLYFTYIFPSQEERSVAKKALLIFAINAVIIVMVAWPQFIIKAVNIRLGQEKEILFNNIFYWFYFAYISGFFTFGFYRLFRKYLRRTGLERLQILYLGAGYALSANLAFVTNLSMPWMGYFFLNWMGQVLTIIMVASTSYAILRYRLMDIRLVVRRVFIYFGVAAFTYGVFYAVIWGYNNYFGGVYTKSAYIAGLIIAPTFLIGLYWFNKLMARIANKYFFFSLYNYQETINKLANELNYLIDLNKIIDAIVNTIKKTMQLNRAGVLLINQNKNPIHYQIAKVIGFNEKNGISLVQDSFLTQYLRKNQKPLVREELTLLIRDSASKKEQEGFQKLYEHMTRIEASLCLPLMSSNKLIGIIVLGSKISKDAYTKEDLDLLDTLSKQAGTAVENAQLYKEVSDFSKVLQQKVNEQTKDLQAQADHLKRLLQMRSEFLDIASHQLKTPVSVILGTISMFKDGSIQKLPPDQQIKFIDNIFHKAKKLSTIINDILRASEMDTDQFELVKDNIKPTKPEDVLQSVYDELKTEAGQKGLEFTFYKPKKAVGSIMADADFLEQAIYNLIDNAIKYTAKGFVKMTLSANDSGVIIQVEDSGIGIPAFDQPKMFDKFSRAKNAVNMYTDGSGLGLFIVKKIVEAHPGGKIDFESAENKGTKFTISMPFTKRK